MSRPKPDREIVLAELEVLRSRASSTEARVSVLALARRVGMANNTFRRTFPDIAKQITTEPVAAHSASDDMVATDAVTEAKLRQCNRDLQDNLDLAVAAIQRLTLENHRLRNELQAARAVTSLRPTDRTGSMHHR